MSEQFTGEKSPKQKPEKQYSNTPIINDNSGFPQINFGNTGLGLDLYIDVWASTFLPEGQMDRPSDHNERQRNRMLYVWGTYSSVEWFKEQGKLISPKGIVRNETNERFHRFKSRIYKELEEVSGVKGIYRERGRLYNYFEYEMRYDRLERAIEQIETNFSPDERNKLRFFNLLSLAKQAFEKQG